LHITPPEGGACIILIAPFSRAPKGGAGVWDGPALPFGSRLNEQERE